MQPTELYVFDFDDTLYRSPQPPDGDVSFYYNPSSFGQVGAPGFDKRWILDSVARARHAQYKPYGMSIVLTGRPESDPMRHKIEYILSLTGVEFDKVVLMPVVFPGSIAQFKAAYVAGLLTKHPTLNRVIFLDDDVDNHMAVQEAVIGVGKVYEGYLPD